MYVLPVNTASHSLAHDFSLTHMGLLWVPTPRGYTIRVTGAIKMDDR